MVIDVLHAETETHVLTNSPVAAGAPQSLCVRTLRVMTTFVTCCALLLSNLYSIPQLCLPQSAALA
eukprot:695114-Rhodomonas_salina.4